MSTVDSILRAFPWEKPVCSDRPISGAEGEMVPLCDGFDDISDQIQQIRGELLLEHRDFVKTKNPGSMKSLADRTERRRQLLDLSCSLRNQQNKTNQNKLEDIARKLTILKEKPPMAPRKESVLSEKGTTLKAHKGGHLGRLLGLATKLRSQSAEYLREKYADDGTAPTECSSVTTASHVDCHSEQSHETVDLTPTNVSPFPDCTPSCSQERSKTVSEICKMFDSKATSSSTTSSTRSIPQSSNLPTASDENVTYEEFHFPEVEDEDCPDTTTLKPASLTCQDVSPSVPQENGSLLEAPAEKMRQEEGWREDEEMNCIERMENYGEPVPDNFHDQVLEALGEILQLQSSPRVEAAAVETADPGAHENQALLKTQSSKSRRRRTRSGLHPSKQKSMIPQNSDDMDTSTYAGVYRITSPHQNPPVYRSRRHFQRVRNSELLAQHPIPKRRFKQRDMDHSERRRFLSNTKEQVTRLIERSEEKNEEHYFINIRRGYLNSSEIHQGDESSFSVRLAGSTCSESSDDEHRASLFLGLSPTFSDSEDEM